MQATWTRYKNILFIPGIFFLVFLFLFLLTDNLIMPLYVRKWQKVTVPDVTRYSNRVAFKMLQDKGLQPKIQEEKFDINYPPGYIMFQNPAPGDTVKKGRRIYLTVCKGYKTIEMPKLLGKPVREARFILTKNQLHVGRIDSNYSTREAGLVYAQSIAESTLVSVETKIDIGVSLGIDPNKIRVPDLRGKSREEALFELSGTGLVLGGYSYQSVENVLPNTVLAQIPSPGTRATKSDTVYLTLSRLEGPEEPEEDIWQ